MPHAVPIGEYDPQVPVQEGLRRIIPEQRGSSVGPAIEELGSAAQSVAKSEAARYTSEQLAKTQSDWTQQFVNRQQTAQPGAPGFTPSLMKDYNDYVKGALKGAPNQLAGSLLQGQLTQFGRQLSQRALMFEANARQDHNEQTAKTAIEASGNELMSDPTVYPQRLAEQQFLIGNMNMDPQVKEKLNQYAQTSMAKFSVQGDIQRDPYRAMLALQDPKRDDYYSKLTPELRDSLMDQSDRMLHQRVSDAERVHSMAKQQQEDASNNLLKQGIVMSQQGKLDPSWVIQHQHTLEPAAMKYLFDEASGKKMDTDLHTYADLLDSVGRGQDVRDDARDALFNGKLSKEDFTRITDKASGELPNSYKRGLQYIQTAGKTSELEPDPAKTTTLANMQNDFQDWVKANPKATDKDTQEQAIDIVKRYQLVKSDQNLLTLPVPQFGLGKGTRATPDLPGAKRDLFKALKDGQINQDDFNRQALLLSKWSASLEATQAKAKPKTP